MFVGRGSAIFIYREVVSGVGTKWKMGALENGCIGKITFDLFCVFFSVQTKERKRADG